MYTSMHEYRLFIYKWTHAEYSSIPSYFVCIYFV